MQERAQCLPEPSILNNVLSKYAYLVLRPLKLMT